MLPSSTAASKVPAAQRGTAFTACPWRDLDLILQFERTVGRDNTVSFQNLALQIDKVSWRGTLARCTGVVHQDLDGTLSMTHGPRRLGRYTSQGIAVVATSALRRYFVSTIGRDEAAIREYIRIQELEDQRLDPLWR